MINAQAITSQRGGRFLFNPVSFEVNAGQVLVIQGNNGVGKTTLLRFLAGIDDPDQGTIIREKSLTHTYIGHATGLKSALSLWENLSFQARLLKTDISYIDAAMEKMGLCHLAHLPVRFFSKGQCQRGALCRLFLKKTKLWLLDEPTVSLDQGAQDWFWNISQEHIHQGGAIIITSHSPVPLTSTILHLTET